MHVSRNAGQDIPNANLDHACTHARLRDITSVGSVSTAGSDFEYETRVDEREGVTATVTTGSIVAVVIPMPSPNTVRESS